MEARKTLEKDRKGFLKLMSGGKNYPLYMVHLVSLCAEEGTNGVELGQVFGCSFSSNFSQASMLLIFGSLTLSV